MKKISSVFWISIAIVLAAVIFGVAAPDSFEEVTGNLQVFLTSAFGWYYLILVTIIVVFCIFLIFSPIGTIKLGKPDEKPEFSKASWFAMLFRQAWELVLYSGEQQNHFPTSWILH